MRAEQTLPRYAELARHRPTYELDQSTGSAFPFPPPPQTRQIARDRCRQIDRRLRHAERASSSRPRWEALATAPTGLLLRRGRLLHLQSYQPAAPRVGG